MTVVLTEDTVLDVLCYPDLKLDKRLYRKGDVFTGVDTRKTLGYFTAYNVNGLSIISEFSEDCEIHISENLLVNN